MLTEERKKELETRLLDVKTSHCPGAPQEGACEFCPGPCSTDSLDGKNLTAEEESFVDSKRSIG